MLPKMGVPKHPYYPQQLVLKGFSPATIPFEHILGGFAAGALLLFVTTWIVSGRFGRIATSDRLWMCWFAFTGTVHLVIEGAFVSDPTFYQDTSGNILKEIWKEYSKADSRYASRDSFTVSMEFVTAFIEGPGCFFILYGIAQKKHWRHTVQLMVSLGQLYGDVLYFATFFLEGAIHSRPEPLYFWGYFMFLNSIWVVVPALNVWTAACQISAGMTAADRLHWGKTA